MVQVKVRGPPYVTISAVKEVSPRIRRLLTPYLSVTGLGAYRMDMSIVDLDEGTKEDLLKILQSPDPVFFDFSSEVDNLWGHLLVDRVSAEREYGYWEVVVRGYLVPSWGTGIGKTMNAYFKTDYGNVQSIGSTQWGLTPTIDTTNKTITWEVDLYNPFVNLDFVLDWTNGFITHSGSGSYSWEKTDIPYLRWGEKGTEINRTTGSYESAFLHYSEDGTTKAYIDITPYPFAFFAGRGKAILALRMTDGTDTIRFVPSWAWALFSWTTEIETEWEILTTNFPDRSSLHPIFGISSGDEYYQIDTWSFSKGRVAVYEFIVPSPYAGSNLVIESYDPDTSSWAEVSSLDIRKPEDATVTLSNLFYNSGYTGADLHIYEPLAIYRLGRKEQVMPEVYGSNSNQFPTIQYSSELGYSFGIGVWFGPWDNDEKWCYTKLRFTYYYDSLYDVGVTV